MTVLEEEVVERTTSPMRRFVVRRPTADAFDPGSDIRREADRLPVLRRRRRRARTDDDHGWPARSPQVACVPARGYSSVG